MNYGKNSKAELKIWARECVNKTMYETRIKDILIREADAIIENGGLRGDISDRWKKMGYSTADIPDMYP